MSKFKHPSSGLRPPSPTRGEGFFAIFLIISRRSKDNQTPKTKEYPSPLVGEGGRRPDEGYLNSKGFTLIEVLVAMVILAIGLGGALLLLQNSARATMHLKEKIAAHQAAETVLSNLQLGIIAPPSPDAPQTGQDEMLGQRWFWSAETDPSQTKTDQSHYQRVIINVRTDTNTNPSAIESLVGFVPTG